VFPWNAVPGVFIVIAQTMARLCSFALARRFLPVGAALFWSGVLRGKSICTLNVYMRSDFAELLACALMPVVCWRRCNYATWRGIAASALARAMAFFAVGVRGGVAIKCACRRAGQLQRAIIFVWAPLGKNPCGPCGAARAIGAGF